MSKLLLIINLSIFSFAFAQDDTFDNGWTTYSGFVGNNKVTLNIFNDGKGNLKGDYCYNRYDSRISIDGKKINNEIILNEYENSNNTARFEFSIDKNYNSENGKWFNLKNNTEQPIKLMLSSWTGGSYDVRYGMGVKNQEVEKFFNSVKKSFVGNDAKWLSENIAYPINVKIGKKNTLIKNKQQFISNFGKIAHQKFVDDIKNSSSCDIFSNWRGAMIANGLIWANEIDSGDIKITAINN